MNQHRKFSLVMLLNLGLVSALFHVCLSGPILPLISVQRCPL